MRKIDEAFSDSLKAPGDVIPIQDVLLVRIEPVARYRPHAILAIRDNAYLSFRASPPLSCYRLNVLFGTAILVSDDREHFALLSVRLDPPRDDLQIGAVRRTPTFDESSIYANDHPLGRFIRFSILGNFPLYLFVDALPNGVDPASGGGMGSSAHRWEERSEAEPQPCDTKSARPGSPADGATRASLAPRGLPKSGSKPVRRTGTDNVDIAEP